LEKNQEKKFNSKIKKKMLKKKNIVKKFKTKSSRRKDIKFN
jgi:hypothetical protein